jgi:hypothetical protein
MRSVSWDEACARRVARHSLLEPLPPGELVTAARSICGVHAQVASAAELSIGQRVAGATRSDVRAALWQRRSLVKTYGPRGTLHLFPSDELALWLAALRCAPRQPPGVPDGAGMDPDQLAAVVDAIGAALDGRSLTWRELGSHVVRRVGDWAGEEVFPAFGQLWPRWRPAIGHAAAAGVLCFGPNRGNQVTYVRVDQWLDDTGPAIDGPTALAEVARRYLSAYGPAGPAEFAQWIGMLPDAAARLFTSLAGSLAGSLVEVDFEGRPAWLPAGSEVSGPAPGSVRLLPHFDAYLIGCRPRSRVYPGQAGERAVHRGAAGQVPALLIDGVVAGVWRHRRSGRKVALTVEPFVELSRAQHDELAAQARRVGSIMEATPALTIGPVEVRPHL